MVQENRLAAVGWWPVDKVIAGYLVLTGAVIVLWWRSIAEAPVLLALHAAALLALWIEVKFPNPSTFVFRHWYPLPYVAALYKEAAILIPAMRGGDYDRQLAAIDFAIWGAHPTVWLERIQSAALTEIMQGLYSLFVPAVLLVAFLLWRRRSYDAFRRYAFLIAAGFLVSYAGYVLVPARGPRFLLAGLQHQPLAGFWLYEPLRGLLDRLESAHYDCFPSGHVELTALAWWGSRMLSPLLSRAYFAYTLSVIFATVYLRYHYTVDVLAGALVAAALALAAPHFYRILESKGTAHWRKAKFSGSRTSAD